jgi:hypothetical protein
MYMEASMDEGMGVSMGAYNPHNNTHVDDGYGDETPNEDANNGNGGNGGDVVTES